MSYLHVSHKIQLQGSPNKTGGKKYKIYRGHFKVFCILSNTHFMWSVHATLISAAVTFAFALPRTDCHNACNDGPAQLCFRGPVDDSISIIIHPPLPGAPWERDGWRKRGVAEPRSGWAEPHLRRGRVGAARASRVAEAACRQCNKITARCSSLHRDARPTTKTAPAEENKFEAGERKREEGGGGTAREQTLILIIGVASHSLH